MRRRRAAFEAVRRQRKRHGSTIRRKSPPENPGRWLRDHRIRRAMIDLQQRAIGVLKTAPVSGVPGRVRAGDRSASHYTSGNCPSRTRGLPGSAVAKAVPGPERASWLPRDGDRDGAEIGGLTARRALKA